MRKRFCFIALLLLSFVLFPVSSNALDPFTARVIYFQPADVDDPNMPDLIRNRMEDVHEFYASEMDRHGFGHKTFRIEKDVNDKIVVHTINGKHNADHYGNVPKTHIAMQPELPKEFLNHKNANIFFIGGIKHYNNGTGGIALGVVFWVLVIMADMHLFLQETWNLMSLFMKLGMYLVYHIINTEIILIL